VAFDAAASPRRWVLDLDLRAPPSILSLALERDRDRERERVVFFLPRVRERDLELPRTIYTYRKYFIIYSKFIILMEPQCFSILGEMADQVSELNFGMVKNFVDESMRYHIVCVRPDVTYEQYYSLLKSSWEKILGRIAHAPEGCRNVERILSFLEILMEDNDIRIILEDLALEYLSGNGTEPYISRNFLDTLINIFRQLKQYCWCHILDVYMYMLGEGYFASLRKLGREERRQRVRQDIFNLWEKLENIDHDIVGWFNKIIRDIRTLLIGSLSGGLVRKELGELLPETIGPLKEVITKILEVYYTKLHPIVWAQIYRSTVQNLRKKIPREKLVSFFVGQILLNSGPFILKILQLVRPALSKEVLERYNLGKLVYPMLEEREVDLMLDSAVLDRKLYDIEKNYAASIGHVVIVRRVDTNKRFVVKLVKPISIVQSCWEYRTLYNIVEDPDGKNFIRSLLISTGKELNMTNEAENIRIASEYYPENYSVLNLDVPMRLLTVEYLPDVVRPDVWYALAMTLAEGIPLSKLVEAENIQYKNTKYIARLYRGLDLLVYQFFKVLVHDKFYHGDLHAGNIFYSDKQGTITLIDFGTIGRINIFEDELEMRTILDIIIKIAFQNYDGILDSLMNMISQKWFEKIKNLRIDEFKQELLEYHLYSIKTGKIWHQKSREILSQIFDMSRVIQEGFQTGGANIYQNLEYKEPEKEKIILDGHLEGLEFPKNLYPSLSWIILRIFEFFSTNGIILSFSFVRLYSLQKAILLLMGVLESLEYPFVRFGYVIGLVLQDFLVNNIFRMILDPNTAIFILLHYFKERKKLKLLEQEAYQKKYIFLIVGDRRVREGQLVDSQYFVREPVILFDRDPDKKYTIILQDDLGNIYWQVSDDHTGQKYRPPIQGNYQIIIRMEDSMEIYRSISFRVK